MVCRDRCQRRRGGMVCLRASDSRTVFDLNKTPFSAILIMRRCIAGRRSAHGLGAPQVLRSSRPPPQPNYYYPHNGRPKLQGSL
jgi:hypothetical protein